MSETGTGRSQTCPCGLPWGECDVQEHPTSGRSWTFGDECHCKRCNGWSRKASRTKCRHCYDTIQRNFPDATRWRDVEHEAATCDVNLLHEPMSAAARSQS